MDGRSAECCATSEPNQASSRGQAVILFGLLLAVQFAAALMPWYMDELDSVGSVFSAAGEGASLAWPPQLAVWAVFGSQRAATRLPLTLWLAAAVDLCSMFAWSRDGGHTIDASIAGVGASRLLAFLVFQSVLWLIRAARAWRLTLPEYASADEDAFGSPSFPTGSSRQFSLRALLGWTLGVALLLFGWRLAAPGARFAREDIQWILGGAVAITPSVILFGLPVVALTWIVMAEGRRIVFRTVLSLISLAGLAGVCAFSESIGQWLSLPPIARSPAAMLASGAGAMSNGLLCLVVVRACGYRLRRHVKRRDGAAACKPQASPTISGVRFALTLAPLVVIAAGLAWNVPHRLARWRRAEIEYGWDDIGLKASFAQDGTATGLECRHKPPLPDEICRRIASLLDLRA